MAVDSTCSPTTPTMSTNWFDSQSADQGLDVYSVVDNSSVLINKLSKLHQSACLSDIELVVGGHVFHAHRLILSLSSDVMRLMLTTPHWSEYNKDRIILQEEPECAAVFPEFLDYLYSGNILLNAETVLPVLMLSDKYGIDDLRDSCEEFMCNHCVDGARIGCIIRWLQYAEMRSIVPLQNICEDFIWRNFQIVIDSNDFIVMKDSMLIHFLKTSDLVVTDEFSLFTAVRRWLMSRLECNLKQAVVIEILSHIRYAMMSSAQLRSVLPSLSVSLDYNSQIFLQEKVDLALQYHAIGEENRQTLAGSSGGSLSKDTYCLGFSPRNYTSDIWNTVLSVNDFSTFPDFSICPIFFSSPVSNSEHDEQHTWDWHVELYPKGVRFDMFKMIGLQQSYEVPGQEYKIVRLAVRATTMETRPVMISVLLLGSWYEQNYVKDVFTKPFTFTSDRSVCNLDNIVHYSELNSQSYPSSFLIGQRQNEFKIMIIIKPAQ